MKKVLIGVLLMFNLSIAYCQEKQLTNKEEIEHILQTFMQCIKTKDSLRFYSLFHHEPVLWVGIAKEKSYQYDLARNPNIKDYFESSYKKFFKSIAGNNNLYEEKFYNIQIIEDGYIASVNFDYSFWKNNEKKNWGKESWGLIKTNNQWKICSVLFSYEYENIIPEHSEK